MSQQDRDKGARDLSPEELHEFSLWLTGYVANLPDDAAQKAAIGEGVRRMEAIIQGHSQGKKEQPGRERQR